MITSRYIFIGLLLLACPLLAADPGWKPLSEDGLHDPASPAIGVLQEPAEALSLLPPDTAGNRVSWVRALRERYIAPRTNILPETKVEILDMDIVMDQTGELPLVLFPHKPHTEWLDCSNCHDRIFVKKVDANPINMFAILSGEYCGQCHGAVAFPLTECNRCHSVVRRTFAGKPGVQPTPEPN
jgi:c(7)-type cytochrome triheme protein